MTRTTLSSGASVLITTKDRKHQLTRAIESVIAQSVPLKLFVVDDGSCDGTAEMVRTRYPQIQLIRNEKPLGIIAARNAAARETSSEILFTLDDDAAFSDSFVAARAIENLHHDRVAAVAIPLVNHIDGRRQAVDAIVDNPALRESKDFPCVFAYRGGANALKRSLFLELGGYEGAGRQGEEHTLCIRLLDAGYVVRVASHGHVDHYPLAMRQDRGTVVEYDTRNSMLFAWLYVTWPQLLVHLPAVVVSRVVRGLQRGNLAYTLRGVYGGIRAIVAGRKDRRPVDKNVYELMRDLIRCRVLPFSQVEARLPRQVQRGNSPTHSSAIIPAPGKATHGFSKFS